MSRTNGYILLYKQIADPESWIWKDKPFAVGQAWIDLIMMANYKDTTTIIKGQTIELKRGQLIRGTDKLAERWGWSRGKVNRTLKCFEKDGMISKSGTRGGTLITIENYNDFQIVRTPNGTADGTADGTGINNNNTDKEEGDFVPPSAADVISFFEENNFESDPKQFYHWYDLNKWTKKNGQPIDDWQQMAHSWEQREKGYIEERKSKNGRSNVPVQPEPPHYPEFEPEPERKAEPPTEEQRKRMRETLS